MYTLEKDNSNLLIKSNGNIIRKLKIFHARTISETTVIEEATNQDFESLFKLKQTDISFPLSITGTKDFDNGIFSEFLSLSSDANSAQLEISITIKTYEWNQPVKIIDFVPQLKDKIESSHKIDVVDIVEMADDPSFFDILIRFSCPIDLPFGIIFKLACDEIYSLYNQALEDAKNTININGIIDRSIEFPAEYHQAGLDILNYFGTYLRKQYPETKATIRIEQSGLNVRMVIITKDGETEVIQKALDEYHLIITGEMPPERFAKTDTLILELKSELRIAKARLENQKDLLGYQNNHIEKLYSIISAGLLNKNNISIDFKPEISLSNNIKFNHNVSAALGAISELLDVLPQSDCASSDLKMIEHSLASIEAESDIDKVRKSSAMSKFRRLIENACEHGSELNKTIEKVEAGWEIFSHLAKKYNDIATWCGLPIVPTMVLKKT